MPEMWLDVDTAVTVPVNVMPLIDDTDFKTRETGIAYNQAGMDLVWNFQTAAGVTSQTAVTPTTGDDYDWTHSGDGMYKIEIPASAGASIDNDTEGFGWFSGICTGVLAWRGPIIGFRAAALNDALIDGGDELDVNVTKVADTGQTANDNGADINTILSRIIGTLASGTHNPQGGDAYARLGTPAGADVSADVAAIKAETALIVADTDELQTNQGNWLTATGFSTHSAAEIWSVATRVLTAGTNIALAKGVGVTGFNDLSAAEINAECDTAMTDYGALKGGTAMTEGYATDGSAATPEQMLYMIWSLLSDFSISGTTVTVKKIDGSTTAMTFTLNDGTTPTAMNRAT